jgi:hypothetical protein
MDAYLHQEEQGDWNFVTFMVQGSLGRRPKGLSLGRIEQRGNYAIDNVAWTTREFESRNRSTVKLYPFQCEQITVTAFCNELKLPRRLVKLWMSWGRNLDYIAAVVSAQRSLRSTLAVHLEYPWHNLPSSQVVLAA